MSPRRDTTDIEPRIVTLTTPKGNNYPVGRMLIASPAAITALLRHIPTGRVLKSGDAVPWWRVVRDDGGFNDKLPGGSAQQARQLQREGVETSSAKRPRVTALDAYAWTVTERARGRPHILHRPKH